LYKIEKLENSNDNNLHNSGGNSTRKHRSFPYSNTVNSNLSNINISSSLNKSSTMSSLTPKQTQSIAKHINNSNSNKISIINSLNSSFEMMNNDETSNTNSNQDDTSSTTNNNDDNSKSNDDSNRSHLDMSLINCANYFNTPSSINNNSSLVSNELDQKSLRNIHYLSHHSNKFNSNSNLDDCSIDDDEDIEININNEIDVYKV